MKKPLIGIISVLDKSGVVERNCISMDYVNSVIKGGGLPVLIPVTADEELLEYYSQTCDGFLFSGGIDISPYFFNEQPSQLLGSTSTLLDLYQLKLAEKVMKLKKPFLGICRGIQLMNVACKGTLYQDIHEYRSDVYKHQQSTDRGDYSHLVSIEPGSYLYSIFGSEVWTNSYHHQSVKVPGEGMKVTAKASDGIIEAIELENYPFGISVQWHPEVMMRSSDTMKPLFEGFVNACR